MHKWIDSLQGKFWRMPSTKGPKLSSSAPSPQANSSVSHRPHLTSLHDIKISRGNLRLSSVILLLVVKKSWLLALGELSMHFLSSSSIFQRASAFIYLFPLAHALTLV